MSRATSLSAVTLFLLLAVAGAASAAINPTVTPDVAYVTDSTRKISQLIGDTDFERLTPTDTRSQTRYGIRGSDLGVPFAHNGRTYIVFGDTHGAVFGDRDALAWITDFDLENGLRLNFLANGSTWRPVTVPGISQEAFEVPLDAVSISNKIYLYHSTDHSDLVTMGRSVLAVSADHGLNFQLLYTLSSSHFINVSVNKVNLLDWPGTPAAGGDGLFIFGSGTYRQSNVRLAFQPVSGIEDSRTLRYFTGLDPTGAPLWSTQETDAIALFDQPSVGELSVAWNKFIKRWVMLYNSGSPRGINFRTARQPWGPWTQPQVLFDPWDDGGYAHFMHASWASRNYDSVHNPGFENTWGGEYGPYMFKEHSTGADNRTTIYFTLSTWNPYVSVLMKTELTVANLPIITVPPADQRVAAGEAATFQLTASAIGTLTYRWQRNNTNITGASSDTYTVASATAADDGATFRCIVSNSSGSVTSNPVRLLLIASNSPPLPQIVLPEIGSLYRGRQTIAFTGAATDPEDGALPSSAFRWQVLFMHANHNVPFLGTLSGVTNGQFTVPTRGEQATNVFFHIRLSVTDSDGRESVVFRDIHPQTSVLRLATAPAGIQIILDGIQRFTPANIGSVVGLTRNLAVPTTVNSGGRVFDWKNWSDDRAINHTIIVPGTNATYTAFYRTPTTLVAANARWKYLVTPSAPSSSWKTTNFNDAGWSSGLAQLGYGDGDEAATIGFGSDPNNKYLTTYFRHAFTIVDPTVFGALLVRLLRDDGGVVYLNGTEIFRSNMGGGAPLYLTEARSTAAGADESTQYYNTNVPPALLRAGTNVIAVEIHQNGADSSDLSFALELRGVENDPHLAFERVPSGVMLKWPFPSRNYVLQSTPSLGGTSTWTNLSQPIVVTNGQNTVTLPPTASAQFHRLRKP